MPLQYIARQERQLEDLDRELLVRDFPVRSATFNWPPTMRVVINQIVMSAFKEIGTTTRSEVVASAASRLGPLSLSGGDLDNRLLRYRKDALENLLWEPIDPEILKKFPRHSGVTLSEPVHILLKEMQAASFSDPSQSDIAGLAVYELAQVSDAEAGEAVMRYRKATVGDLFPDPNSQTA